MKFTFIVPVYNGEKYIRRCLDSLINQKYKAYEIIIINDGSKDNSLQILKEYQKKHSKYIKIINQENKGLSISRNNGLNKATGDYILFIDIDDYIHEDTLTFLSNELKKKKYDLIKFEWANDKEKLGTGNNIKSLSGNDAIVYLINKKRVFEMAVLYAYNLKFLKEINFCFKENRFHEDFGIIPITILKSNSVLISNNILYYYDQNVSNSITNNNDYNKTLKKANDILKFYEEIKEETNKIQYKNIETIKIFKSFNANVVLSKYSKLKIKDKIIYKRKIKELDIIKDLYSENLKGKIKKILYSLLFLFY